MGEIVQLSKITHVPSMFVSEMPGPNEGCRDDAIQGLKTLGQRAHDLNVDTFIVLDTHWLVNSGYHINCNPHHKGVYTSNEFPHFIKNIDFDMPGNSDLGHAIAERATELGTLTRAHSDVPSLGIEYGTLVPMKYMNPENDIKVVSVAAWMYDATFEESRDIGKAIRHAVEASDSRVSVLASGSLSHRIHPNVETHDGMFRISSKFNEYVDLMVVDMLTQGRIPEFLEMLPEYAVKCSGEGGMHDTVILMELLGWDGYSQKGELISNYFPSSGTGQVNIDFPTPTPQL